MKPRGLLLMTLLVLLAGASSLPAQEQSMTDEEATKKLMKVDMFALGPVGFAATTSEGETCFDQLLKAKDAKARFTRVIKYGGMPGKLYALLAFKKLAPKEFPTLAQPFLKNNQKVQIMQGCIVSERPASLLAQEIVDGVYDKKPGQL